MNCTVQNCEDPAAVYPTLLVYEAKPFPPSRFEIRDMVMCDSCSRLTQAGDFLNVVAGPGEDVRKFISRIFQRDVGAQPRWELTQVVYRPMGVVH